jgi:Domain of unknown function (DUF5666)
MVDNTKSWTLYALAQETQITRLVCVEGWSAIGKWTGTPLREFLRRVGGRHLEPWIGRIPHASIRCCANISRNQWEELMEANYKMTIAALAGVALGALAMMVSGITTALAQDTVRVRGTIERIDGSTYVVKARDGAELKVTLADNPQIAGVVKASLSEIKQGSFVGVTAMPQADGSQRALEVHIFPEAMRGTGEGHYPWDLRPQSTMTNANVEQVVTAVDGQTLTLKYKDGEKKIFVPANAPIVVYVQGDKSDLKPGAKVFIAAIKQPDGTLQGRAWRVGRDGVTPPM